MQPFQPYLIPAAPVTSEPALSVVPSGAAAVTQAEQLWDNLTNGHLREHFFNPDIGALEITLSAAVSHYHKDADPAWLFVLGPSSGDKTSIIINCCLALEGAYLMGDLTPKTFLSGYTGDPNASLLHQIGSGILVFKDFTTFASKREDEQTAIASQLREIYDGLFKKNTGKGAPQEWHGKMTVIAAATPALERHWGTLGDLGERFLQVRIARKSGIEQAEYAQRQSGKELFIKQRMKELAQAIFRASPPITYPPPKPDATQRHRISCLAEIIAHSRGKVPRNNRDEIIGVAEVENSSRASKELNSLVSGHAALFRRHEVDTAKDMWIAQRVALNSIPSARYLVIAAIASRLQYPTQVGPAIPNKPIGSAELQLVTRMPLSTLRRTLADLHSLNFIRTEEGYPDDTHHLTDEIAEIWYEAFPLVQP